MVLHALPTSSTLIASGRVCLGGRCCLTVRWTCSKAFCPIGVFRQGNSQFLPLSDLGIGAFWLDTTKVSAPWAGADPTTGNPSGAPAPEQLDWQQAGRGELSFAVGIELNKAKGQAGFGAVFYK